jgi:hypothetical protein
MSKSVGETRDRPAAYRKLGACFLALERMPIHSSRHPEPGILNSTLGSG